VAQATLIIGFEDRVGRPPVEAVAADGVEVLSAAVIQDAGVIS